MDHVVNEYFSTFHWKLKVTEDPAPSRTAESSAPASENLSSIEAEQKSRKVLAMRKVSGAKLIFHCANSIHSGHPLLAGVPHQNPQENRTSCQA